MAIELNFLTQILKTACKKYAETWKRPLRHPGLAPTEKKKGKQIETFLVS